VAIGGTASLAAAGAFYSRLPSLQFDAEKLIVDQGMTTRLR
jgi:hypothetical protein